MKLLLDENLSPRLAQSLSHLYPGTLHVENCGFGSAGDEEIWCFARDEDFVIVSKNSDFFDRATLRGGPPKMIWLRVGNSDTATIEKLLTTHHPSISAFGDSPESHILILAHSHVIDWRRPNV